MWIKGNAKRECAPDTMVEVEMMHGAQPHPTPVRADHVVWRDVLRWREVLPADDWTEYETGVSPMPASALRVEIQTRHGDRDDGLVTSFEWGDCANDTIVRYRVIPTAAPADDWIEWHGGACPVTWVTQVQVKLRDGAVTTERSQAFRWNHEPAIGHCDIVAYRVVDDYRAAAVAEHDRLTEIIALKDAELAKAFTAQHTAELYNAELVEQLTAADKQLAHVRECLVDAESQLSALTGCDRLALDACEAERDKLLDENHTLRNLGAGLEQYALDFNALKGRLNIAAFRGYIPLDFSEQLDAWAAE